MTTSRSRSNRMIRNLTGVGIFVLTLFLYLLTRYPSVAYIDSGELAVVNGTLGIAHPTGYPLYTILGRLFALLPLELMTTQVMFGALCTAVTAAVLFFTFVRYFDRHEPAPISVLAMLTLLFASAPLIWGQGTTNEVYSLHLLFISLILALLLSPLDTRRRVMGPFVVALAFGNHMSTILLLPAIAVHLYSQRALIARTKRIIPLSLSAVVVGASLYLYLPVRAALDPIFNWGQPHTWENFVRHVTGWQYQVWMFSKSPGELAGNLWDFAQIFYEQFPALFWLPVALGIITAWRRHRHLAMLLSCFLVFNCLYALNFSIPDIDNYLLPSVVALFGFGCLGVWWLIERLRVSAGIAAGAMAALVVWGLMLNWQEYDQSQNLAPLDGVHNLYASAETNALIFCADWDIVSPWLYSHFALGERPDVILIDNELARRSWYFDWIRHVDARLYEHAQPEIEAFLPQVRKFERSEPYDPQQIETAYQRMLMKFLQYRARPLYIDQSANLSFPPPGEILVSGQLLRIVRDGEAAVKREIVLREPRFGKPGDALNVRERFNLEKYERMVRAASDVPDSNSAR